MKTIKWWQECEIEKDRAWEGQYYCAAHSVWFRDDNHPCCCPAAELADKVFAEYSQPIQGESE